MFRSVVSGSGCRLDPADVTFVAARCEVQRQAFRTVRQE